MNFWQVVFKGHRLQFSFSFETPVMLFCYIRSLSPNTVNTHLAKADFAVSAERGANTASTCKGLPGKGGGAVTRRHFLARESQVQSSCGALGTRTAPRRPSGGLSRAHFYPHLLLLFLRKQILSLVSLPDSGAGNRPTGELSSFFPNVLLPTVGT